MGDLARGSNLRWGNMDGRAARVEGRRREEAETVEKPFRDSMCGKKSDPRMREAPPPGTEPPEMLVFHARERDRSVLESRPVGRNTSTQRRRRSHAWI